MDCISRVFDYKDRRLNVLKILKNLEFGYQICDNLGSFFVLLFSFFFTFFSYSIFSLGL